MMALSGVRTSWLIRASRSALALAERSLSRRGCCSLLFLFLGCERARDTPEKVRQVAEHREEVRTLGAGPPHGYRQRNQAAAAGAAEHVAAGIEQAGDAGALDAFDIIADHALAFRREQLGDVQPHEFVAVIAEQRLGAAVARIEVAFGVEHHDA